MSHTCEKPFPVYAVAGSRSVGHGVIFQRPHKVCSTGPRHRYTYPGQPMEAYQAAQVTVAASRRTTEVFLRRFLALSGRPRYPPMPAPACVAPLRVCVPPERPAQYPQNPAHHTSPALVGTSQLSVGANRSMHDLARVRAVRVGSVRRAPQ